jgi:glycosyltransferase involved in cell wall biosynthesis
MGRFVYYLEDFGRTDFSLQALHAGRLGVGGQAARLRMLFWLARRGHDVFLLNPYDEAEVDGVRAVQVGSPAAIPRQVANLGDVGVFTFNNSAEAPVIAGLDLPSVRAKVLWAGNPIPPDWCLWADGHRVHRIVFVSHSHRDAYRIYPTFRRFEMIYSGCDLDLLDETPALSRENGLVVFLGAPRVTKGFHNLLRAWPDVRRAVPHARLHVIGATSLHDARIPTGWTGVLEPQFEREYLEPILGASRDINALGIEFAGLLPMAEVFRTLQRAEVAVVNCNWDGSTETYCRSAMEAQACGTPVVGAARGSLPEVIRHGVTGLLVDEPSPGALAGTIAALLKDELLRARLSAAGPAWARSVADYGHIAADWEDLALRTGRGEDARGRGHFGLDLLRALGYGRARLAARRLIRGRHQAETGSSRVGLHTTDRAF